MNRVKNCVFLVRKWSYTTFNIVNIRKMWEKKGKIRRTRSMTKKRSSEIFTLKMEIFPEIGPQKNVCVPPNSAPGLRPCLERCTCPFGTLCMPTWNFRVHAAWNIVHANLEHCACSLGTLHMFTWNVVHAHLEHCACHLEHSACHLEHSA